MKSIRCDILDWHRPTIISNDGVNTRSICSRCGRPIMKDSQGNWFSYGERSDRCGRPIMKDSQGNWFSYGERSDKE